MKPNNLREVFVAQAIKHDSKADKSIWLSAVFCEQIVGNYDRGATLGLASDMSRSPDTIEDRAHAYNLFKRLCKLDDGEFRLFVFQARRAPYIHYSHFRALYDLQKQYELHDAQIIALLQDIVQAEGDITSRNLEDHVRKRFGDTRDWTFYAAKALKELNKTEGQPDLPNTPEGVGNVHSVILTTEDGPAQFIVIAYNKSRAEEIARKQMAKDRGEDVEKEAKCIYNEVIGEALTDSKNILNVTSSWLGDNA